MKFFGSLFFSYSFSVADVETEVAAVTKDHNLIAANT